jgi:glycerol-3-phosphate cytidylyltransferase
VTRIGFAPGVYDLFHIGHLNILREARRHCDRLVAGVTSDDLARCLKGRAPVVPLAERLDIVRSWVSPPSR